MRWIRFSKGNRIAYGSLNGDTVTEIAGSPWVEDKPTGTTRRLADGKT